MALILRDSFDTYNAVTDLILGPWTTISVTSGGGGYGPTTNTRFGVGKALRFGSTTGPRLVASKIFGSNEKTLFLVFALGSGALNASSSFDYYFRFYDGNTVQCSIGFTTNGNVVFYRGDINGTKTQIASFSSVFSGSVWTHFQIKIVLDATNGLIKIRKNGNTVDDFSATGLNTLTTANAYANMMDWGDGASLSIVRDTDDFVLYSDSGSGPWNDWVGDIRAVQQFPYQDTEQKDFSDPASVSQLGTTEQSGTFTVVESANTVYTGIAQQVTGGGGSWSTLTVGLNTSLTGSLRAAIYDSDGASGSPGSLLAVSDTLVNPSAGNLTFTFTDPPDFLNGHNYYIAIMGNASFTLKAGGVSSTRYTMSNTFSAGFPSTFSGTSASARDPVMYINISPTNAGQVNEPSLDRDVTYLESDEVGDVDLYFNNGSPNTPSEIFGISFRGYMYKTDSEYREALIVIESSGVQVEGPTLALGTSYQEVRFDQDTDPATGELWTIAGINNFKLGPKVAA